MRRFRLNAERAYPGERSTLWMGSAGVRRAIPLIYSLPSALMSAGKSCGWNGRLTVREEGDSGQSGRLVAAVLASNRGEEASLRV